MPNITNPPQGGPSVLATLRHLIPNRPLSLSDALWIAERQANRLLQLRGCQDVPVPTTIVTRLPRITVEHDPDLPADAASGCSTWDWQRRTWVISLNPTEPRTRRRFTVLHEYKHIIDHGSPGLLPTAHPGRRQRAPEEIVADYFAGCVLIPKRLLTAAYYDGFQRPRDLAELFDVSPKAITTRLSQVGLSEPSPQQRASSADPVYRYRIGASRRPATYYRSSASSNAQQMEVAR